MYLNQKEEKNIPHIQMGFPTKHFSLLCLTVPLISILAAMLPASSAADYTDLVFKGCADQKFQDPSAIYTKNLKNLFDALIAQSSQKSFFTTTSGDGQTAITGLYQCRGDLTTSQCSTCVRKIPDAADRLCGKVISARVQLSGCYLKYELVGFKQESETALLFKVCGSTRASGAGFVDRRDSALKALLGGVQNGFYTGEYQSVFVLGQCEGDLSSGDCGNCVKSAVESVKNQCGASISGQVYFNKCYISYSYYPRGVPSISSSSSGIGTRHHTQRTVAIAVGGVAAFGFLVVCLLFAKSLLKKQRRGKHEGWN